MLSLVFQSLVTERLNHRSLNPHIDDLLCNIYMHATMFEGTADMWSFYLTSLYVLVIELHVGEVLMETSSGCLWVCLWQPLWTALITLLLHLAELSLPPQRATFITHNPITGPQGSVPHQSSLVVNIYSVINQAAAVEKRVNISLEFYCRWSIGLLGCRSIQSSNPMLCLQADAKSGACGAKQD